MKELLLSPGATVSKESHPRPGIAKVEGVRLQLPISGLCRKSTKFTFLKEGLMLPGQQLRILRERLGFTLKDVELASVLLAQRYENAKYWIPQSRLSNIESKGIIPNIYRLQAFALIYRCSLLDLLAWYGIQPGADPVGAPPNTYIARDSPAASCELPVNLDPLFDPKRTSHLRRMIQEWGVRPLASLCRLEQQEFTYAYVGSEDYTLYPLLLPGSLLQIDTTRTQIEMGPWKSELERPIYFLETHNEYLCGWCAMLSSRELQLQPHHLSGLAARVYKFPNEIEVVGQVVGIATKLRSATPNAPREPAAKRE